MGRFTRDATGRHPCPHPQCTEQISNYIYACRSHWFDLPPSIRTRITSAWRRAAQGDSQGITDHDAACTDAEQYWADRLAGGA